MAEIMLIPQAELATGESAAIRKGAIAAVKAMASKELNIPEDKLVVRDIQPGVDLGYTYSTWDEVTGSSTAAYETMTSGTMSDRRYVGIYGVKDDSEGVNVTKIRVKVGNSIKSIWHLESLYSVNGGPRIGFAPSVVVIPEKTPYTIERYVYVAAASAQIKLKGFVVEPFGKVLSP